MNLLLELEAVATSVARYRAAAIDLADYNAKTGTDLEMEPLSTRISQAISDPRAFVGRKLGPSWGEGNDGYAGEEETVTEWSTRAVLAVLGIDR